MLISTLSAGLRLSSRNFSRERFFCSVHSETRIEPGGNGCRYSSITVKALKRYCKGNPLFPLKFLNETSLTSVKLKVGWTKTISEDQARISAKSFIEDSYRIIMYTALASLNGQWLKIGSRRNRQFLISISTGYYEANRHLWFEVFIFSLKLRVESLLLSLNDVKVL